MRTRIREVVTEKHIGNRLQSYLRHLLMEIKLGQ